MSKRSRVQRTRNGGAHSQEMATCSSGDGCTNPRHWKTEQDKGALEALQDAADRLIWFARQVREQLEHPISEEEGDAISREGFAIAEQLLEKSPSPWEAVCTLGFALASVLTAMEYGEEHVPHPLSRFGRPDQPVQCEACGEPVTPGYPFAAEPGRWFHIHCFMYTHSGELPDSKIPSRSLAPGERAVPTCDNDRCVSPEHLIAKAIHPSAIG